MGALDSTISADAQQLGQAARSSDTYLQSLAAQMYRASADDRGTVQALAQDLDEAQEAGKLFGAYFPTSFAS